MEIRWQYSVRKEMTAFELYLCVVRRFCNLQVFHAGTSSSPDGGIIATGGRVLAVTALADTVALAQQKAYKVLPPST